MPIFWLCLFLLSPFWLLAGLALLGLAPSLHAKLVGVWLIFTLVTLWLWRWNSGWATRLGLVALATLPFLLSKHPGMATSKGGVSSISRYPSLIDLPFNLISERDLSEIGIGLFTPRPVGRHVLTLTRPLYAEMEQDPAYRGLPHVVGSTAQDLLWNRPGDLHFTVYLPSNSPPEGTLFFYHGAMGNFQLYLHFWRKWAQANDWAVVCPSNGFGRWYTAEGERRAVQGFDQALETLPLSRDRVVVVGMSNGATAVTRLVNQRGDQISGVLLVCPVLEAGQLLDPRFVAWTQSHAEPIVIEGSLDSNVPPAAVEPRVLELQQAKGRCNYRLLEGHDHHLMFSAADEVYKATETLVESLTKVR